MNHTLAMIVHEYNTAISPHTHTYIYTHWCEHTRTPQTYTHSSARRTYCKGGCDAIFDHVTCTFTYYSLLLRNKEEEDISFRHRLNN